MNPFLEGVSKIGLHKIFYFEIGPVTSAIRVNCALVYDPAWPDKFGQKLEILKIFYLGLFSLWVIDLVFYPVYSTDPKMQLFWKYKATPIHSRTGFNPLMYFR